MKDIKSGACDPRDTGQLDALNEEQMTEIAKYYAKQTRSLNQA
jgi:cytochrome c553